MGYSPITPLAFLLLLSFTHNTLMAQGRPVSNATEVVKGSREEEVRVRTLIGSRPPRCERRCSSCVRCEAIQVPIVPQHSPLKPTTSTNRAILYSRGENLSNYKPLSWKCKCGNLIFNPKFS